MKLQHCFMMLVVTPLLHGGLFATLLAQDSAQFASQGDIEIGGNISFQRTSAILDNTTAQTFSFLSILPYVGYFPLDEGLEVGLNPLGVQYYWDGQDKITTISILGSVAYNASPGGRFYPFVEGQLGYNAEVLGGSLAELNPANKRRDGIAWGLRAGVKIAVVSHCLVNAALQYQQTTLTPSGATLRSGADILSFSAGLTFWL